MLVGILAHFRALAQTTHTATPEQKFAFEVSTVKPSRPGSTNEDWDSDGNRVTIRGYSLRMLIRVAFGLKSSSQIVEGPDWLDKQHFDITAKLDEEQIAAFHGTTRDRDTQNAIQTALQTLLRERFKLQVDSVHRELPIFALVRGPKVKLTPDSANNRNLSVRGGHLEAAGTSTDDLTESLTRMREVGDRVVINRTGITGRYKFEMNWTPDRGAGIPADAVYPGLFTALPEQLGLRLKPDKGVVPVIEVVAAEMPAFD
ncbi:MAG TPA: TIGR03435 family protein [Acidobacteriaceae bacterium]|jgi:uncharacterized protein (TIGR03435 family)